MTVLKPSLDREFGGILKADKHAVFTVTAQVSTAILATLRPTTGPLGHSHLSSLSNCGLIRELVSTKKVNQKLNKKINKTKR